MRFLDIEMTQQTDDVPLDLLSMIDERVSFFRSFRKMPHVLMKTSYLDTQQSEYVT